jgi:predicted alpha/beta superfamily hydrolase
MSDHAYKTLGPFSIPSLGATRNVRVYVPPGAGSREPRPVLYLFDGQNVFDDEPSYAGGWHVDRAVDSLAAEGHTAPVVVGIDHGGVARIDELSPWPTDRSAGRADLFLDWMLAELAPEIQRTFDVAADPSRVMIGGSSMGGLAALYAHFRHPEAFGGALVMSPSLWIDNGRIFEYVASRPNPDVSRVYVDAGALEANGAVMLQARRLVQHLQGRGYDEERLSWYPDTEGTHSEQHWRRRIPFALRFLCSAWVPAHARERIAA